jgi:hypothetical protein
LLRWWSSPPSADSAWRALGSLALLAALYGATVATKFNGAVYRQAVLGSGPFAHFWPLGAAMLIRLGFLVASRRCLAGYRHRGDVTGPGLLMIWSVSVAVMTTLWLPLDWPRYYMPFVPVFCLLQGLPVEAALRWLLRQRRVRHRVGPMQ